MSHSKERKEKVCLNCNAAIIGRYCHNCGQENKEPKESIWHFTTHFLNDFTHFDGKFFTTLKDLLFRPGFLSKEFVLGRRASYLDPVRMYLFTSFFFFLIYFSLKDEKLENNSFIKFQDDENAQVMKLPAKEFDSVTAVLNHGKPMTRDEYISYYENKSGAVPFGGSISKFKTVEAYDSSIATSKNKPSWFGRKFSRKQVEINQKYQGNNAGFYRDFVTTLKHKFPQILFVSLPFLALFLKLLYVRRKQFYYVSHAIFTIHLYIFIFVVMMAGIGIAQLTSMLNVSVAKFVNVGLAGLVLFYLYKAMRNFYGQKRGKTLLKYFLFLLCFLFLMSALMTIFVLLSVLQV